MYRVYYKKYTHKYIKMFIYNWGQKKWTCNLYSLKDQTLIYKNNFKAYVSENTLISQQYKKVLLSDPMTLIYQFKLLGDIE